MTILAVLSQPGPVAFVVPSLLHARRAQESIPIVLATDPAWVSAPDRAALGKCEIVGAIDETDMDEFVAAHRPTVMIVSTTGSATEVAAMSAATALGVRTVRIIDVPYNHAERIRDSAPPGVVGDAQRSFRCVTLIGLLLKGYRANVLLLLAIRDGSV